MRRTSSLNRNVEGKVNAMNMQILRISMNPVPVTRLARP